MLPDPSMDIDGDGAVSAKDLKMASAFDANGDGVLQTTERRHLRRDMIDKAVSKIRTLQKEHQLGETPALDELVQVSASNSALDNSNFDKIWNINSFVGIHAADCHGRHCRRSNCSLHFVFYWWIERKLSKNFHVSS